MTALDLSCAVTVDGVALADRAESWLDGETTALDGLTVTWGRQTTADQPDPSVCTFTVQSPQGTAEFWDALHLGATVRVYAAGRVTSGEGSTQSAWVDPTLMASGVAANRVARSVALSYASNPDGHGGLTVHVARVAGSVTYLDLTPAVKSAVVGAWDGLPSPTVGQPWTASALVFIPAGFRAALGLMHYVSPNDAAPVQVGANGTAVNGTDTYQRLTVTMPMTSTGGWIGARVTMTEQSAGQRSTWAAEPGARPWSAAVGTWAEFVPWVVADVTLTAPATTDRRVLVFSGRVSDLRLTPDGIAGAYLSVTATDFVSALGNWNVGDTPWLAETLGARFARIIGLGPYPVAYQLDARPAALPISWRDVDRQPMVDLLRSLAVSADAVLWPAVYDTTGPYLRLEDPSARVALNYLALDATGRVVIQGGRPTAGALVSACYIIEDSASWEQDDSEVTTRVEVTWKSQTTDPDTGLPAPTDLTVVVANAGLEGTLGIRRTAISTELSTLAAATAVGTAVLARQDEPDWRASSLVWDTLSTGSQEVDAATVLDLLDGTERIGLPIIVDDLPTWAPVLGNLGLYIEGGTYRYERGAWALDLIGSAAGATGASMTWADLAGSPWTWEQFDPAISWLDLSGVAAHA